MLVAVVLGVLWSRNLPPVTPKFHFLDLFAGEAQATKTWHLGIISIELFFFNVYLAWPFHPNSTLSVPQLNLPRSSRGYVAATFDKVHQAGTYLFQKKTTYPWNNPSIPKAQNWAGRNSYSIGLGYVPGIC